MTNVNALRNELIDNIRSAENVLPCANNSYYISQTGFDNSDGKSPETAWNLNKLYAEMDNIQPNSNLLFRRGDTFRLKDGITLCEGVSYGAYGVGDKPIISGSLCNYAELNWKSVSDNVWSIELNRQNAGIIVFNNGECIALRKLAFNELIHDLDFFHDVDNGVLYLYSHQKPSERFFSIEIGVCINLFGVFKKENINIDNIKFIFTGRHAIAAAYSNNVTVTNCEFGWIGGSSDGNGITRLGNAVEFYGSGKKLLVDKCYIYQIFDAGLTFQVSGQGEFSDITFSNNLIEYCAYNIEFFNYNGDETGTYKNILIENNVLLYAGYGLATRAEHREWWVAVSHICGWRGAFVPSENFVIRNNIFYRSITNLIFWKFYGNADGINVYGNSFYQSKTPEFARDTSVYHALTVDTAFDYGVLSSNNIHSTENLKYVNNQLEFESAVRCFDKSPKEVAWID